MKKWANTVILVIAVCFLLFPQTSFAKELLPTAKNGILDLREQNGEIVKLSGQWEFYWEQLLVPDDFQTITKTFATVPHHWRDEKVNGEKLPAFGYATYRLTLLLPSKDIGEEKAIILPNIASSYRIWINGDLKKEIGRVGKTEASYQPMNSSTIISFSPTTNEIEIVIQVSNFSQRKGGIWTNIEFGNHDDIVKSRELYFISTFFLIGSLLIIGLYHFVMYLTRRKETIGLFFALTSFSIAIRMLVLEGKVSSVLFPSLPWELEVKIEYISAFAALVFFNYYIHSFLEIKNSKFLRVIVVIHILLTLFVLFTPVRIYSFILPYYSALIMLTFVNLIIISIKALIAKTKASVSNFIAIVLFAIVILNDILFYTNVIHTTDLVPYGLYLYLFVQAILLSARISEAFNNEELMREQLKEINVNLESIVQQRTQEIIEINLELQEALDARIDLISSISHEMRSPLTTIKGYVKGMIDGVFQAAQPKQLQTIYNETIFMERMLDDLFELSLLELGQYRFDYEKTEPISFFNKLFQKYEFEVSQAGLDFEMNIKNQMNILVNIDPIRIEQVFVNLLRNALRNTTSGSISVEMTCSTGFVSVSIIDTGSGIDPMMLPLIFTKFIKGQNKNNSKSSGIGLSICKEIIKTHDGDITVTSQLGEGSQFTIVLPTIQSDDELGK